WKCVRPELVREPSLLSSTMNTSARGLHNWQQTMCDLEPPTEHPAREDSPRPASARRDQQDPCRSGCARENLNFCALTGCDGRDSSRGAQPVRAQVNLR